MMLALALALYASTSAGPAARPPAVALSDDPPIHVWLSSDNSLVRGERARVYVRAAQDGYILVLHANAQHRVQVLFPIEPGDDAFVDGEKEFEVLDRGDGEALTADDDGTGTVFVAWSATPFVFDGLVRGDQWDLGAAGTLDSSDDVEAGLVKIVQGTAVDGHFDYDVATYTVRSTTASNDGDEGDVGASVEPTHGGSIVGVWIGAPWPYCGSYYWTSWGCGPYYGPYYPVAYRPYWYRPYGYNRYYYGSRPYGYGRYGYGRYGYGGYGHGGYGYPTYRSRLAGSVGVVGGFRHEPGRGTYAFRSAGSRSAGSWNGSRSGIRVSTGGRRVAIANRVFARERSGLRASAPGSRTYRDGGYARPSSGGRSSAALRGERSGRSAPAARSAPSGGSRRGGSIDAAPRSSGGRSSAAPRGERSGRSAPAARSAPSGGSRREGWSSPAPRSSGGYSRGGGGGGGGRPQGGGGGGGGGRHEGGGGGGGGRRR